MRNECTHINTVGESGLPDEGRELVPFSSRRSCTSSSHLRRVLQGKKTMFVAAQTQVHMESSSSCHG